MKRQTTPLLIPVGSKGAARPLTQESLRAPNTYDERWIQELIHHHPRVLPIASMEPAFWPAVPICMELPLRSGFLDNLLVTPLGDLIAVECKLWRNAEARREVIA